MSDGLVAVDPNSAEAKNAVLALLGTTLAELKQLDRNVVGSSKNISGVKTDLQNVFRITTDQTTSQPVQQPALQPTIEFNSTQAALQPVLQQMRQVPQVVAAVQQPAEDPNQLVFDFNKPITPTTINDKLDRILDRLDRIIDLFKTT
jgi:hypothetical protein